MIFPLSPFAPEDLVFSGTGADANIPDNATKVFYANERRRKERCDSHNVLLGTVAGLDQIQE